MVARDLESRGIRDPLVLRAMGSVPREAFLPSGQADLAYSDRALPLSEGQTISQPYMVAAMTEALRLEPEDRVLEIGTGSGYQTAVLAEIAEEVFTVERLESLSEEARKTLDGIGYENVRFRVGDGSRGWPEEAPFDAVVVTAAAPGPPASLKEQVTSDGGRMVIPEGSRSLQELVRYTRDGDEWSREALMGCRFVPLLGAEGW